MDDLTLEELDEYDPNKRKSKGKTAAKAPAARSTVKAADVVAHTLDEPQLHLLSNASIDQLDSSSQPNASFNLAFDSNRDDDALFNFGGEDGIGLGNTELDLGLDLGEGWEYPTQATIAEESGPRLDDMAQSVSPLSVSSSTDTRRMDLDFPAMNGGMGDVVEIGMPMDVDIPDVLDGSVPASRRTNAGGGGPRGLKRVRFVRFLSTTSYPLRFPLLGSPRRCGQGYSSFFTMPPSRTLMRRARQEFDPANLGTATPRSILITPSRFGSALPDQHAEGEALQPVPAPRKPAKKVRLLLDERIELTDAEMKVTLPRFAFRLNSLTRIHCSVLGSCTSRSRTEFARQSSRRRTRKTRYAASTSLCGRLLTLVRSPIRHGHDLPLSSPRSRTPGILARHLQGAG